MPHGGPMIEGTPAACPSSHSWGPPVRGVTRVITGWMPCQCAGAGDWGGHRYHHCECPGCETPWVLQPACTGDPMGRRAVHTRPDLGAD